MSKHPVTMVPRKLTVLAALSLVALGLAGCGTTSSLVNHLTPYKIDINQGNYVTQDAVDKLKPGMTRAQVRFLLGTPLVQDAFHANRWDYVYRLYKSGDLVEQKQFTVWFENDVLAKYSGDVMPALKPALAETPASAAKAVVAEAPASAAKPVVTETPASVAPVAPVKAEQPENVASAAVSTQAVTQ